MKYSIVTSDEMQQNKELWFRLEKLVPWWIIKMISPWNDPMNEYWIIHKTNQLISNELANELQELVAIDWLLDWLIWNETNGWDTQTTSSLDVAC